MRYFVTGSNVAKRALTADAVEYANRRLKIPKNVDVYITLSNAKLEDGAYGWCNYSHMSGRRTIIEMEVYAKLDEDEFVSTVFHELKHAQQFADGSLHKNGMVWRGRDYSMSEAYDSLPWEIAAKGFETRLLNRWRADYA